MKNQRILILLSWLTVLSIWLFSCTPQPIKPITLTMSVAASYRDVIPEIDKLYKQEKPNVKLNYNIAGSANLKKQIEEGAPVDIFLGAGSRIMNDLQTKGILIPETHQTLMKNNLVLIVPKDSSLSLSKFEDLTSERVKKVALGTEKVVIGIYIKEVLNSLGIYNQVKQKGVFTEEELRPILKAVETKQVDAGITFLTEAKLSNKVKVVAIAPENSYSPAVYSIAVLKRCQNVAQAKEFIQFLRSDRATAVFEKYGFTVIK